jgi:hypothetical protein
VHLVLRHRLNLPTGSVTKGVRQAHEPVWRFNQV